ncbi:MAG: glycosyltransferase [Pyrinomonadaceae bacterium]
MKSVHITNYYHKDSGGISTAYNKLLEAANRRRRHVRLIVPGEHAASENIGEFGKIYYVKAGYSPVFDKRYRVMLPWNSYIFDTAPIKTILREEQPEIIEIGEKYTLSLMAGLLRKGIMTVSPKRPMLVHLSCERMDDNVEAFISRGRFAKWFSSRFMGNYVVPMFDFHIANSTYTAKELTDSVHPRMNPNRSESFFNLCWRFLRSPKSPMADRVFVNQCGVDNVTFTPTRRNRELRSKILKTHGLPEDACLLLYAGRVSPEKNVGLLLEMMDQLNMLPSAKCFLLVAGDGPMAEWLRTAAAEKVGRTIKMLGQIGEKEELADLFANCDVFVHPNPREPFGITPLEAMASGIAVVAPNAGGVLSYATNENAWLTEPEPNAFAESVLRTIVDTNRSEKIANALRTAESHTWEASTDSLFALYDKMYKQFTENSPLYSYSASADDFDFGTQLVAE